MKKLQDPWFHTKEQETDPVQEARHSPKQTEKTLLITDSTDPLLIP